MDFLWSKKNLFMCMKPAVEILFSIVIEGGGDFFFANERVFSSQKNYLNDNMKIQ